MNPLGQQLVDDHEQINRLLRHGGLMLRTGMRDLAVTLLSNFQEEILHHMNLEETRIMGPYEKATGNSPEDIAALREQHAEIERRTRELVDLAGDPEAAEQAQVKLGELETILEEHIHFEEGTLYRFAAELAEKRRAQAAG